VHSERSETDFEALIICLKTQLRYSPLELKKPSKSLSIDGPGIQCGDFQKNKIGELCAAHNGCI
jgi:hypothetical protein